MLLLQMHGRHMKSPFLAIALVLVGSMGVAAVMPSAPQPEASPQGFGMKLFNQPGSNPNSSSYDGKLNFFFDDNPDKTYTVDPQPIYDPSTQVYSDPAPTSALSLQQEKNMGFGVGIPLFGGVPAPANAGGNGGSSGGSNELQKEGRMGAGRAGY